MEAGEVRPGYELWRPNREKPESQQTKAIVTFLLLVSAGVGFVITIGGWTRLEGGGAIALLYVALYLLFAFFVARWNRGVLPVAAALAIVLVIFSALATPGWFNRTGSGFDAPLLPEELLGLLTLVLIPLQIALIAFGMIAFNQEWQVEEERPIGGVPPEGDEPGAGPGGPGGEPVTPEPQPSPTPEAPPPPEAPPGPQPPPQQQPPLQTPPPGTAA
jgi:hypothetical protein